MTKNGLELGLYKITGVMNLELYTELKILIVGNLLRNTVCVLGLFMGGQLLNKIFSF
jgi:hypothetical protein